MSDLTFRIKAQSASAAKTIVKARNFELVIDEPEDLGGSNSAPNPVEYVLSAFAGCLNVMGHLIANEMGFTLNGLQIDISGNLNPARLFGQSNEERAGYKSILVKIKPDCNVDEATLEQWLSKVEERCPVSDNIQHPTPVKLELMKK